MNLLDIVPVAAVFGAGMLWGGFMPPLLARILEHRRATAASLERERHDAAQARSARLAGSGQRDAVKDLLTTKKRIREEEAAQWVVAWMRSDPLRPTDRWEVAREMRTLAYEREQQLRQAERARVIAEREAARHAAEAQF